MDESAASAEEMGQTVGQAHKAEERKCGPYTFAFFSDGLPNQIVE